ncbi:MAG: fibronectin type III domain-containing protein, partial [Fibrobacteres bacterium]|nr:fibronectin type III domain-containing protein [Fibrobacterota bacterium]
SIYIRLDTVAVPANSQDGYLASAIYAAIQFDTLEALLTEKTYYVSLFVKDRSGNWSTAVSDSIYIDDTVPPLPVTLPASTPLTFTTVALSWKPSLSSDADSVMIRYSDSATPIDTGSADLWSVVSNADSTDTITGLVSGNNYYVSLFVKDINGNWSPAASVSVSPLDSLKPALSGAVDDTLRLTRMRDGSHKVFVSYRVDDRNDTAAWIGLEFFNGTTWTRATSSGDTGIVATSDSLVRIIEWASAVDYAKSDSIGLIRLVSSDGKGDYSKDTLAIGNIPLDFNPPVQISIEIIDSAGYTYKSDLKAVITANGADSISTLWNSTAFAGVAMQRYTDTISLSLLISQGKNVLNVLLKDSLGNMDTIWLRDTTVFDSVKPVVSLMSDLENRRIKSGLKRDMQYYAQDLYLKKLSLKWRTSNSTWDTITTITGDSGVVSWTLPPSNDSIAFVMLEAYDSAGNYSLDSFTFTFTKKAGTPAYLKLSPAKVVMALDSILPISVSGMDSDSIPVGIGDLEWSVSNLAGFVDSMGLFRALSVGKIEIIGKYLGVSDTIDSIEVFYEIDAVTGLNRVNSWLTLKIQGDPQGKKLRIFEIDSAAAEGIKLSATVLDFSKSDSMPSGVTAVAIVNSDSLKDSTDKEKLRVFEKRNNMWYVDTAITLNGLIAAGVDTMVPVIVNNTDTFVSISAGNSKNITVQMIDNVANGSLKMFVRYGGQVAFDSIAVPKDSLGFFSTSMSSIPYNGCEYYLRAYDGTNISISGRNNISVRNSLLKAALSLDTNVWKMVSFPAKPATDSLIPAFRSLGEYLIKWRLYEWNGNSYVESGASSASKIGAGKAYWCKTLTPEFYPALDSSYVVPISKCF